MFHLFVLLRGVISVIRVWSHLHLFMGFFFPPQMSKEWEMVVCGQTKDQLIMTEKARRYLRSLKSHAPSRALILSWDGSCFYAKMLLIQNLQLLFSHFSWGPGVLCGGERVTSCKVSAMFEQHVSDQVIDSVRPVWKRMLLLDVESGCQACLIP